MKTEFKENILHFFSILDEVCFQPAKTGLCRAGGRARRAYFTRWYYNAERQECNTFIWGGCEGGSTSNKFPTKGNFPMTFANICNLLYILLDL